MANDRIQLAMDICHGILKANHARYQLCHAVRLYNCGRLLPSCGNNSNSK